MNNLQLSKIENKKLYLVSDYNLQENEIKEYDTFNIISGNLEEVKNTDQEATFSNLANLILSSIYDKLKGRIDKVICISCHENNMSNFIYADNVLDTMTNIMDIYSDPTVLIINIVPYELSYWTEYYESSRAKEILNVDNLQLQQLISKYEYLGFRPLPITEDVNDNRVLIYMNSAGINFYNTTLRVMEYDYGK